MASSLHTHTIVNVLSSSERKRMKIGEGFGRTDDPSRWNNTGNFSRRPDPPKNSWWAEERFEDALARETPRITGKARRVDNGTKISRAARAPQTPHGKARACHCSEADQ